MTLPHMYGLLIQLSVAGWCGDSMVRDREWLTQSPKENECGVLIRQWNKHPDWADISNMSV